MPSLNKVFLMGNLTRDPEQRTLPSGQPVTEFGLAISRRYRTPSGDNREETTFVEVCLFGRQAETAAQYLRKGRPVFIEGRLRYDSWEGKDGQKRSRLMVVGERYQFVGGNPPGGAVAMGDAPEEPHEDDSGSVPTEPPAGRSRGAPEDPARTDVDNLPF